jgi:uncharacterized lipoprotein YmbA
MMLHARGLGALCVVAALATGCSTTPPSHFYTLTRETQPPGNAAAQPLGVSVVVGPVSIPALVDAPQIVVSTGANQVSIDEFNRWAAPLASNISRVVAEDLVVALGTPRVTQFQQSVDPVTDYRVSIEVQAFDSALGDAATLNAVWIVRRMRDNKSTTGRTALREPASAAGYDALVAAHSRALGQMSRDIADAVRALNRAA